MKNIFGLILLVAQLHRVIPSHDIDRLCNNANTDRSEEFKDGVKQLRKADLNHSNDYLPYLMTEGYLKVWCEDFAPRKKRSINNNQGSFMIDFVKEHDLDHVTFLILRDELPAKMEELLNTVKTLSKLEVFNDVKSIGDELRQSKGNLGFVLYSDVDLIDPVVLKKYQRNGFMENSAKWLIKSSNPSQSLADLELKMNSHIFTFHEENQTHVSVNEAYRPAKGQEIVVNPVGVWDSNVGLVWTKSWIWERRNNLHGHVFHCATEHDPPYLYLKVGENGELSMSGYIFDIWTELQSRLNFSSTYVKSIDGSWGSKQKNGSFNGMIGMIEREEVQCGATAFSLKKTRAEAADFVNPVGFIEKALFVKVGGSGDGAMTYISPLKPDTWMFTGFTMIACVIVMAVTFTFGTQLAEDIRCTFWSGVLVGYQGFILQGTSDQPTKGSSRMGFISTYLTGVMVSLCYSATLTSFLAVKSTNLPFTDEQTMLSKTNYKLLTLEGTSYEDKYKYGTPLQQEIYRTRMIYGPTVEESIEMLKTIPNIALEWQLSTIDALMKGACGFETVPSFSWGSYLTFFITKNSTYRDLFNYQLNQLQEGGQLHKMERKWIVSKSSGGCGNAELTALGLDTLYTIFYLLSLSIPVSVVVLLLEIVMKFVLHIFKGDRVYYRKKLHHLQ